MLCRGIGIGLTLDPHDGDVCIVVSLHDEEDDEDATASITLTPERAAEIGLGLLTQASAGQNILNEIMSTPLDDREAAITRILERMRGTMN